MKNKKSYPGRIKRLFKKLCKEAAERRRIEKGRKHFFDLSIDPMCILGLDGYFKAFNPALTEVLGWTEAEFWKRPWMHFVHPDDLESSKDAARKLLKGEKITFIENKFICRDGNYRWLSWKAAPVLDEGFVYAIAHDITEEKKDREIKKLNEDRLNSLLLLSKMTDVGEEEIRKFTLESVVRLTKSKAGYLHFVNEDNKTIELVSWSEDVLKTCTAAKESHYPVEEAGIWADSVRLRRPVIHNDYQGMTGKKGYPEGHFHLIRHLSVPVFDKDRIVAVAGVGNKEEPYDEFDVGQFDIFMYNMWGILKQRKAEEILKKYSMEDSLTGLSNRRRFDEVLHTEWRRAFRDKNNLSIILFDIDFFKKYNDIYGHQMGDECLRKLALCLRGNIRRAGELIARYGGEEFIAVLPGINVKEAYAMADTMRLCVQELDIIHAGSPDYGVVTVSAGVAAVIPDDKNNSAELIERADRALYKAKAEGRNVVREGEL